MYGGVRASPCQFLLAGRATRLSVRCSSSSARLSVVLVVRLDRHTLCQVWVAYPRLMRSSTFLFGSSPASAAFKFCLLLPASIFALLSSNTQVKSLSGIPKHRCRI